VRFPNIYTLVDLSSRLTTLAGLAGIAITRTGDPLPWQLPSTACTTQTGMVACVDDFFAIPTY